MSSDGCSKCSLCDHDFDPHELYTINPLGGGIILCQEQACDCATTWSVGEASPPQQHQIMMLLVQIAKIRDESLEWITSRYIKLTESRE